MTSLPALDPQPAADRPLVVRTAALDMSAAIGDGALHTLLPDLPPTHVQSWVRRGEGLIGWGRAAVATAHGPERFDVLDRWWQETATTAVVRDEVGQPGTGPVAFGSIAYAASSPAGATLIVPEVIIGVRGDVAWLTTVARGDAVPNPLTPAPGPAARAPQAVTYADDALSSAQWAARVSEAVQRIGRGELDKVVLARDLDAQADEPVDPRWLLTRLAERYANTWVFCVDGLIGATPELLVRRDQGLVTSRVLAGTIRRTGNDEQDLALSGSLARSSKDLEEHEYAVRSVADALAPHCSSMNVPEAPFVLHLPNVMHLATDVAGVLTDGTSALALAASLHPSAAVCGTPKAVADALIAQLENMDRGRYAGPVGWMDANGDGEWGIALRCAAYDRADQRRLRLFAGCGIVAGSDPAAEVAESDAKLVPMRDALSGS
ncbi:MAG: isochorismate synthase MenF [Nostocoides sp.]